MRVRHSFGSCMSIQEPDCHVHSYYSTAMFLLETYKLFVVEYFNYSKVPEDQRLAAGSVLMEYLTPLMKDTYIMDELILHFFLDLMIIKREHYYDIVIRTILLHFSPD